jgi:hypothetical protein
MKSFKIQIHTGAMILVHRCVSETAKILLTPRIQK